MGLFSWLNPGQKPKAEPTLAPPPGAKAFGTGVPIEEMTKEDVSESQEALYEACESVITGWELDCGVDHKSTLFELAFDGVRVKNRADLPKVPPSLELRCRPLGITETELRLRNAEPAEGSVAYLATTKEELEGFCDAIYSKKTTKKETKGRCYFCGFCHHVPFERNQSGAANFLANTNQLTREVLLGVELASDFAGKTAKGDMTAQQWLEQKLRPIVLAGSSQD